jgi:hypothetical protein
MDTEPKSPQPWLAQALTSIAIAWAYFGNR